MFNVHNFSVFTKSKAFGVCLKKKSKIIETSDFIISKHFHEKVNKSILWEKQLKQGK